MSSSIEISIKKSFKDKLMLKYFEYICPYVFRDLVNNLFTDVDKRQADNVYHAFTQESMSMDEFEYMWTVWLSSLIDLKSAFLIVDVQNDFITGSLALDNLSSEKEKTCSQLIPIINAMIDTIPFKMVVYTLDWHPPDHVSFADCAHLRKITRINGKKIRNDKQKSIKPFDKLTFNIDGQLVEQIVYPTHCVKDSWGAQLHEDLKIAPNSIKVYKGTNRDVDSYSGFKDNKDIEWTELDSKLKTSGITDVYICGLAYDICVYYTALDALSLNYRTILVEDCCQGTKESEVKLARQKLEEKGCLIVTSTEANEMVRKELKSWKEAYESFGKLPISTLLNKGLKI